MKRRKAVTSRPVGVGDAPVGAAGSASPRPRWRSGASLIGAALVMTVAGVAVGPADGDSAAPAASTAVAASPARDTDRARCGVDDLLVPTCGRLFGVAPVQAAGSTWRESALRFERQARDRMSILHAFHRETTDIWPTDEEIRLANEGRLLFVNWRSHDLTWRQVADGAADTHLRQVADRIESRFPQPFFLSLNAEMEDEVDPTPGSGQTATDFRDFFRHVVELLRAEGADNIVPVVVYTGDPSWTVHDWYEELYPGDDVVAWVGFDPYAFGEPPVYQTNFAGIVDRRLDTTPDFPGFATYAAARFPDKPLMLAEWGVIDDPDRPRYKGRFFRNLSEQLTDFPQIRALVYFNSLEQVGGIGVTRIDSSRHALRWFRHLLDEPMFQRVVLEPGHGGGRR